MTCTVNGQPTDIAEGTTVRELLRTLTSEEVGEDGRTPTGAPLGLAVAVDGAVVPRSRWATMRLTPGAESEGVEAVQV